MKYEIAPSSLRQMIVEAFTDLDHPAYGQATNIDSNKVSQARTVHIHYLPEHEVLAFNAHIASAKWKDLQADARMSGCYFDLHRAIQFRWESTVELVHSDSQKYAAVLDRMWESVREDVREAYWLDSKGLPIADDYPEPINVEKRTPSFGTVLCEPTRWDVYVVNPQQYRKGRRVIATYSPNGWTERTVSILHGT